MENDKKLIIFGDSVLKGIMYDRDENRYRLVTKQLKEEYENDVEIVRCCHMGSTIEDGLEAIERFYSKNEADEVLLEFGGNDSNHNWKEVSENPDGSFYPTISLEDFENKYQMAIDKCRSHGSKVRLATLIPIDAHKFLEFVSKGLSKENILKWLGDESMLYRWHEGYNRIVESLAVKNNLELIDLRKSFLLSHDFKQLLCDDGIHPTITGHKLIEKELIASI